MTDAPAATTVASQPDGLDAWLSAEYAALEFMLGTLAEERHALARGGEAMATLPDALVRKQRAADALRSLDGQLPACLRVAPDAVRTAFSQGLRAQPTLAARWHQVSALAARARAENDGNGRLVITRLHYNRAALDALLSSRDRSTSTSVYGANGRLVPR